LWATAYAVWRQGNCGRAVQLLQQAVNLTARRNDPYMAALAIEMLAWIAGSDGKDMHRSAVLLGAATALSRSAGTTAIPIPDLVVHHIDCETAGRQELGSEAFSAAFNQGMTLDLDSATDYAAGKLPVRARFRSAHSVKLTARESEVADLVADGLTNRAIAERLTISVRTAQGHVEHILTKLGFTSRTQIATWVIERGRPAPG
jgi:non-specific serine/threonine protein kinase